MIDVVLLYEATCPNVAATRKAIEEAMAEQGLSMPVREVERSAPELPEEWRSFGSPTVLVDGCDVMGEQGGSNDICACRLYHKADGSLTGVPPTDRIASALAAAMKREG